MNSALYSSYKSHTTYKGNVVISPSGEIIHISSLFEGSISDKELVRKSGLLPLLDPEDQLMADKGFIIQDILDLIPLTVAGSINQIRTVACLITNFQGPLFYET